MKKTVTLFIVTTCVVIGLISVLRMVNKNILVDKLHMDNSFTRGVVSDNPGLLIDENPASISWAKRYPFEEVQKDSLKVNNTTVKIKPWVIFENKINGIKEKLEYYYTDALIGYPTFLEIGTVIEETFDWGMPLSIRQPDYVILPNGHVTGQEPRKETNEAAGNLIAFGNLVREKGMEFLYVQFPHKVPKYEDEYVTENADNYSNENADNLLMELQNASVPYLDIRESIYQTESNHYDCFYRTDHHWKLEMGLFTAGEIANRLELEMRQNDIPLWEEESYRIEVMENSYLGSFGRNLTKALIKPDDLKIYYPDYTTSLHVICEEMGLDKTGEWKETLLDERKLLRDYSYTISQYDAFAYGDRALIQVENLKCSEGKRVLLIKDSFADVLSPYLALGVQELVILDLRMFNGSVESFLNEYNPDVVIVAYNPAVIAENGKVNYNTHKDLWDFR